MVTFALLAACSSAPRGATGSQPTAPVPPSDSGETSAGSASAEDFCPILARYLADAPGFVSLQAQPLVSLPGMVCDVRESESELEVHCEVHAQSQADAHARHADLVQRVAGCVDEAAWSYSDRIDEHDQLSGVYTPNDGPALIGLYTDTVGDDAFVVELDVLGY